MWQKKTIMKKVLILYGFEYSGHHSAALALRESFLAVDPSIEVDLVNFFAYTSKLLERLSTRAFYRMVKSTPGIWDSIYCNPRSEARFNRFRKVVRVLARRDAGDLLESHKADAVVCTQAFPCGMINDFKKKYGAKIPLYAVLTDYFVPSYWIYDRVDAYFVGNEEARQELISGGIDERNVFNEGIPISPRFRDRIGVTEARRQFGIPPDRRTVVVTGGWSGWGSLEGLAVEIERAAPGWCIVVVTGRNKALYESLREQSGRPGSKILLMEYVERFDILLQAADLLVGKAGGLTAAEALASGVPLVLVDSLPGQERANADYLCRRGAALMASGVEEAVRIVTRLINSPSRRSAMRGDAEKMARAGAALRIVEKILERDYVSVSHI